MRRRVIFKISRLRHIRNVCRIRVDRHARHPSNRQSTRYIIPGRSTVCRHGDLSIVRSNIYNIGICPRYVDCCDRSYAAVRSARQVIAYRRPTLHSILGSIHSLRSSIERQRAILIHRDRRAPIFPVSLGDPVCASEKTCTSVCGIAKSAVLIFRIDTIRVFRIDQHIKTVPTIDRRPIRI